MATAVLEEAEQWSGGAGSAIPAMTVAQAVAGPARRWEAATAQQILAVRPALRTLGRGSPRSDRRGRRRPGAGHLQPGFGDPHLAGRRDARAAAGPSRPGIPVVIGRNVSGPVSRTE